MDVIGYLPHSDTFPFIPELLVVEEQGEKFCMNKKGEITAFSGSFSPVESFKLPDGAWLSIEEDRMDFFELENEWSWRSKRAQHLMKQISSIRGDPLRVLSLSKAAGFLQGLDIARVSKHISSVRKPDESLKETLERIKHDVGTGG